MIDDIDSILEEMFRDRFKDYILAARDWWKEIDREAFYETGSYPIPGAPTGLEARYYKAPSSSAIPGIQAFPYVPVAYLHIPRVPGGVRKMIDTICGEGYQWDEFTLVVKRYLHGTDQCGQFIAIIPTDQSKPKGMYVWLSEKDMTDLSMGVVGRRTRERCDSFLKRNFV